MQDSESYEKKRHYLKLKNDPKSLNELAIHTSPFAALHNRYWVKNFKLISDRYMGLIT